jgi:hypothetical protein
LRNKKRIFVFLWVFCLAVSVVPSDAGNTAFPGAEGWAADTPGGRGGEIIRVTNLNAEGSGSFASAVAAPGPRIVVFEVGGVIDLKGSVITISNPYLTIAGQTAPSPGITFIDGGLLIGNTHDIVIQHIRVRPGASRHRVGWEPDGISVRRSHHVILDHCSVSWAVDENMSASGPRFGGHTPDAWRANTSSAVTFSHNIIAEALSHSTHSKREHSKGSLIHDNATEIAVLKNLYTSNMRRNPYFKGGARGVVLNNYIDNPGASAVWYNLVDSEWGDHPHQTGQMSVVGNVMQYGQSTQNPALMEAGAGPLELFMEDNIALNRQGGPVPLYDGENSKRVDTKPVWHDNLHVLPAEHVREYVLANAGARPWDRDEIDARIINNASRGTGKIIDFETEAGGFPDYPATYAAFNESDWDLSNMMGLFPVVSIAIPSGDQQIQADSTFHVRVEAGDYDGTVQYVELYVNDQSRGRDSSPPYEWQLGFDSAGDYSLTAVAEDDDGRQTVSRAIRICVH